MREIVRVFGVVLGGLTVVVAFSGLMFRFDTSEEYRWALWMDVKLGFAAALSAALVGLPPVGRNTLQWRTTLLICALFVGLLTSGGLAWHHYEQHRIRSTPLWE